MNQSITSHVLENGVFVLNIAIDSVNYVTFLDGEDFIAKIHAENLFGVVGNDQPIFHVPRNIIDFHEGAHFYVLFFHSYLDVPQFMESV